MCIYTYDIYIYIWYIYIDMDISDMTWQNPMALSFASSQISVTSRPVRPWRKVSRSWQHPAAYLPSSRRCKCWLKRAGGTTIVIYIYSIYIYINIYHCYIKLYPWCDISTWIQEETPPNFLQDMAGMNPSKLEGWPWVVCLVSLMLM